MSSFGVETRERFDRLRPVNSLAAMRLKHGGSEAWRNFASRICRSEFMRRYLRSRGGFQCALCANGMDRTEFVIHHIDYDHECGFGRTVCVDRATVKRPGRVATVPDCERCRAESVDLFLDCAARLAAVHKRCNWRLGG